eukprot:1998578-Pleurochrysis_carterae.AAC.1
MPNFLRFEVATCIERTLTAGVQYLVNLHSRRKLGTFVTVFMQYLVNLHSSCKPGTLSAVCYYSAEPVMNQSAQDRQPLTRAPKGAGKRRAGRARERAQRNNVKTSQGAATRPLMQQR